MTLLSGLMDWLVTRLAAFAAICASIAAGVLIGLWRVMRFALSLSPWTLAGSDIVVAFALLLGVGADLRARFS